MIVQKVEQPEEEPEYEWQEIESNLGSEPWEDEAGCETGCAPVLAVIGAIFLSIVCTVLVVLEFYPGPQSH